MVLKKITVVVYLPHYDKKIRKEFIIDKKEKLTQTKVNDFIKDFKNEFGYKYEKVGKKYVKTNVKLKKWFSGLGKDIKYKLGIHQIRVRGKQVERSYRKWNNRELNLLKLEFQRGTKRTEIANRLRRSYSSTITKLSRIKRGL